MASKIDSWKIFLTLDKSFFVSLTPPAPSSQVTFSSHLFLFPMGLTSLYLCFRVATAVLWIIETPHPYSKQHTEAQMLSHKHTSISVSNLWWANSRWGWPAWSHTQLHAVFEASLWWSCIILCVFIIFFSALLVDKLIVTFYLYIVKPLCKGSRYCPLSVSCWTD